MKKAYYLYSILKQRRSSRIAMLCKTSQGNAMQDIASAGKFHNLHSLNVWLSTPLTLYRVQVLNLPVMIHPSQCSPISESGESYIKFFQETTIESVNFLLCRGHGPNTLTFPFGIIIFVENVPKVLLSFFKLNIQSFFNFFLYLYIFFQITFILILTCLFNLNMLL